MSGKKWWSTKVDAKLCLMSNLVIFSTFSLDIPSDFHEEIQVVSWKHLMILVSGMNTK